MPFKLIFAGTPHFALPTLEALISSKHEICAVYTQPDRPSGRGRKLTASAIKQLAQQHHLPLYQPVTVRDTVAQQQLQQLDADLMIVIAYGLILPKAVLDTPPLGCINVHASLLPAWRGAAPIQRAILAGDNETGISIMQMDEGLDTGDILKQCPCVIRATDSSADLHDHLASLGAECLLETLAELENKTISATPQDNARASYAQKINKQEAKMDWTLSAAELDRQVRAFNPWPVAFTEFNQRVLRIWQAQPLQQVSDAVPGTILVVDKNTFSVATGEGVLQLLKIQLPGGRPITAKEFLSAWKTKIVSGTTKFI